MPRKEIIMATFSKSKLRKIFEDAELEVSRDVLEKICDLHTDTLDGLNDTVKELKTSLEDAERERDDLKAKVPKEGEENPFEKKYNDLKKEYDDFKADTTAKETKKAKENAVREYFESKNIKGNNLELAMRGCTKEVEELELEDNKIKDTASLDTLVNGIFSNLVVTTTTTGVQTPTPPASNGKSDKSVSRASQLASEYHSNLYGKVKEN